MYNLINCINYTFLQLIIIFEILREKYFYYISIIIYIFIWIEC